MVALSDAYEDQLARFRVALATNPREDASFFYSLLAAQKPDLAHAFLLEALGTQIFALVRASELFYVEDFATRFPDLSWEDLQQLQIEKTAAERVRLEKAIAAKAQRAGPDDPPALSRYDGNWQKIGRGGQGQVWRGTHLELDWDEAVKILHGQGNEERAATEARKLAKIGHSSVCRFYGYEVDLLGRPCLRMQYVPGVPASKWALEQCNRDPRRIARLLAKAALGVQAIHEAGLVHADLKPANIIVTSAKVAGDDIPIVVDLGLARAPGLLNGQTIGTEGYIAPEQAQKGSIDFRADIYSLGIVFIEMVAGIRPGVASPSSIPIALTDVRAICRKATGNDPDSRYASARQLAEDLERYSNGKGEELTARPFGLGRRGLRWIRHRWKWIALSLQIPLVLAALSHFAWQSRLASNHAARESVLQRLEAVWKEPASADATWQAVDDDLDRLSELDPSTAEEQRVKYIDTLLGRREVDLARLERAVRRVSTQGDRGIARLRSPVRTAYFRQRVAPEELFDKLDFYFRPNKNRVADLETIARLEDAFGVVPGRPGVRLTLGRAYMAAHSFDRAWAVESELLERSDLLPAWRLLVFRELVWVAISSGDLTRQSSVAALLRSPGVRESDDQFRPAYRELAVEEARLLCAAGRPGPAADVLDSYLRLSDLDLKPESPRTLNTRFDDGPLAVNVPVLFFLDGALLRGFLPNSDTRVWERAFKAVQGHRTGSYYEAAVLGSLSNCLAASDAVAMTISTAEDAATFSPLIRRTREIPSSPKALEVATEILQKSWQTVRGRTLARQIATRRLAFDEFAHVQLRLWMSEGLRVLTHGQGGKLVGGEDEVFWGIANDLQASLTSGSLEEKQLFDLITFVAGDIGSSNFNLPKGITHFRDWPQIAHPLGPRLRGPVAYVIGHAYMQQVPIIARPLLKTLRIPAKYFDYSRQHAACATDPAALRKALESDSRGTP